MIMHIYCPSSKLTMSKPVQVTFTYFFNLFWMCPLHECPFFAQTVDLPY